MPEIGIRQLKNEASEIIRTVREEKVEYIDHAARAAGGRAAPHRTGACRRQLTRSWRLAGQCVFWPGRGRFCCGGSRHPASPGLFWRTAGRATMMSQPVLLDTDILSAIMRRDDRATVRARVYLTEHHRFAFSVVTRYEVMRGLLSRQALRQQYAFEQLCAVSETLPISPMMLHCRPRQSMPIFTGAAP
jgi:hypothetical protein